MRSLYLSKLNHEQRKELEYMLWTTQKGLCFICEKEIDLKLHKDVLDIDHVQPLSNGGKDDVINFALTHSSCNRSKQAADLRVARVLARFREIRERVAPENRNPNLNDVFQDFGGAIHELNIVNDGNTVRYSFVELGDNIIHTSPLYIDKLSGFQYFFTKLPIAYIFHDEKINPRSIGNSLSGLIDEFYKGRPQLHVPLGWINLGENITKARILLFDGQHKAAAQVLLGVNELPVRVFVNPDLEILLAANTNAGTTLRQVAFDKSVQRHLGSSLYADRIERYRTDHGLTESDFSFSESDLIKHFKGETRELRRYILDAVRNAITHHPDNALKEYIDFGGRSTERPLSYSTVEKTFYSFYIYPEVLSSPLSSDARELETVQIVKLMRLIALEIYSGQFDQSIGTSRVENKIQTGEIIPEAHLRAYRLSKEEIMWNWLKYVQQIIKNYFIMSGHPINEAKLFQYEIPPVLWDNIQRFVRNLKLMPVWVNRELSLSVFGGKQNYEYWQTIFEKGQSPQGQQVLPSPINLMEMIKE